jgi:choline kinase
MHVKLLYNPFYAISDNLISLWVARGEMDGELLLLNGDTIFHPAVLDALLHSAGDCCLLAGRKSQYEADAMKLQLCNTRVARVGKEIPAPDAEALGILRFSAKGTGPLRSALEEIVFEERALYSHFPAVIQHLIDRNYEVSCCFASEFSCSDIDTPADLDRVHQHLHLYSEHNYNGDGAQPVYHLADSPT